MSADRKSDVTVKRDGSVMVSGECIGTVVKVPGGSPGRYGGWDYVSPYRACDPDGKDCGGFELRKFAVQQLRYLHHRKVKS
jgi:hypothetical protein